MLTVVSLLLSVVACCFAVSADNYIVGGTSADIADFPHQGSLQRSNLVHECGCVLIHAEWALTAASCDPTTNDRTEWGTSFLGSGGTFADVSAVYKHPDYGQGAGFEPNDIAVLRLSISVVGDNIAPIRMTTYNIDNIPNAAITGWGRTCSTCSAGTILHGAIVPIISPTSCQSDWGDSINEFSHICIQDGTAGTCNGDAGGALMADSTLHGISSWQEQNCDVTYPSVYTRIHTFRPWVCGVTDNQGSGC